MPLLFATLGFRFFFGTRLGAALFTFFGAAAVFGALMLTGKPTTMIAVLAVATVFAAKRAFTRR